LTAEEIVKNQTRLEGEELNAFAERLMTLPDQEFISEIQRLITPRSSLQDHYRPLLTRWGAEEGSKENGALTKRAFEIVTGFKKQVKDILGATIESEEPTDEELLPRFEQVFDLLQKHRMKNTQLWTDWPAFNKLSQAGKARVHQLDKETNEWATKQ
jgi:hypothetical protein